MIYIITVDSSVWHVCGNKQLSATVWLVFTDTSALLHPIVLLKPIMLLKHAQIRCMSHMCNVKVILVHNLLCNWEVKVQPTQRGPGTIVPGSIPPTMYQEPA